MSSSERDKDAYRREWVMAPHTKALIDQSIDKRESALGLLLRKAADSSDAEVRAALAEYNRFDRLVDMLEKGTI